MHILEDHDDKHGAKIKLNARTSTAAAVATQGDLKKVAKTARGTVSSAATPSTVVAVTDAKRASAIEGAPSSPTSSIQRSEYLAAGVLPFCVLGGDLLFLLGQQLRFCSRGRGASFSENDYDSAGAGGAADSAAVSERGVELRESTVLALPPRRPRCGPRPRLSPPPPPSSPTPKPSTTGASPKKILGDSSPSPSPTSSSSCMIASHHDRVDDGAAGGEPHGASTSMTHDPQQLRLEATEVSEAREVTGKVNAAAAASLLPQEVEVCAPTETETSPSVARGESERGAAQDSVPAGLLWSDFGGGREAGDADAEETASREFAEESFGLFNGVRLQSDSVARSQATMEAALRDPTLGGKRVFECRNGSYVMFIAEVDFVPDIMMKLARKEIVDGGGGREGGPAASRSSPGGKGLSPGFSEKTDFAWVPATSLLKAMWESRHRSTRRVVVKLGDCRYLRLFHKFVISLWRLDLAAVVRAALTPLPRRNIVPFLAPRILLLKPAGTDGGENENRVVAFSKGGDRGSSSSNIMSSTKCAIRGIDCVRPSFLSGRKRTSLGIIDPSCESLRAGPSRRLSGGSSSSRGGRVGEEMRSDRGAAAATGSASLPPQLPSIGEKGSEGGGEGDRGHLRSRKSGAACRKRRRQRKEARRLRAAAVAAAAAATQAPTTRNKEAEERTHAL